MDCPKCKAVVENGIAFCTHCGYNFSSDNIIDTLDKTAVDNKEKKVKEKKEKKSLFNFKKKTEKTDENAKKRKLIIVRSVLITAAVLIVIAAVIVIASLIKSNEGIKTLDNLPIGRDLAYAESKTGKDFVLISRHTAVADICEFDGIYESEDAVRCEGVNLPEWAVTVQFGEDQSISKASYYDFAVLQNGWKGQYCADEIAIEAIEYGMTEKEVERKLGFEPYVVIKDIDNTITYIYRYYYTDTLTGDDVVCNYCVIFNDIDGNVKDVFVREIEYKHVMMRIGNVVK